MTAARTPAEIAASGPRSEGRRDAVAEAVRAVREGWRLHYGPEQGADGADPDLALLHGDHRYAEGLQQLAALGDLPAIVELAEVIALCAQAAAEDDAARAAAAWEAGATAIGWGADPELVAARARLRAGDPQGAEAVRAVARRVRGEMASER